MLLAVTTVEHKLENQPDNWQRFLSLPHIKDVASSSSFSDVDCRATLAVRVLNRLTETEFTPEQQGIIQSTAIKSLQDELRTWVTASVDLRELMAHIEEFEIEPTDWRSQPVSSTWNRLRWSLFPTQQQLSQVIDTHYRNANVRFAITEEFINRLVPAIQDVQAPIREKILGLDVRGLSETSTRFRVNLVPDKSQIRMQLEGDGVMNAKTQTTKGGVTLMNRNRARFFVQKMLLMDPRGLRMSQTQSAATGSTNITGLRTRFDTFPIVGSIVRRAAQKQAFESKDRARTEFETKVAMKARSQMDNQLQEKVQQARARMDEKLIRPMERLELNPTALAMETTEDRLTLRGRLAGGHQLASFTARPQARTDSVLSIQIHESALNNFVAQLNLSGKQGDLKEVFLDVAKQVGMSDIKIPEEVPDGVEIRLAKRDPVQFHFRDGRLMIALRVDGMRFRRNTWRHFEVHAYYKPAINGFRCDLNREEHIELIASKNQVALRGIFTKVFSKNRPIPLIHPELGKDSRLTQLDVSQFVVRDGWIGVSVGNEDETGTPLTAGNGHKTARPKFAR